MMRSSIVVLFATLFLFGCGSYPDFGLEKATGPLAGTFKGKAWAMAAGEARAMTGSKMMVSLWSSTNHQSCQGSAGTFPADEKLLMFVVPVALGTYQLPDDEKGYAGMGYAYYISGLWTNVTDLAHTAMVKIASLQTSVEGALAYDAGDDVQVVGTFSVPVCTVTE